MNKFRHAGAGVPLALAALFCFSAAPATAANITIVNSSCTNWTTVPDGQGGLTISCETTPPPSGAPSCTSLSANTTSLGVGGGNVTLTANGCTAGASFEWSASPANAALSATTPTDVGTQAGIAVTTSTTFSVTPVKDTLKGSARSVTVSVASAPPPPPPPTGAISCAGFAGTAVLDAMVPANGAANKSYYPSAYQGWGSQVALVVRFTAPPADSAFHFSFEPYGSGLSGFHNFMVASEPCVFDSKAASAMGGQASTKTAFVVYLSSTDKPNPNGSYIKSLTPGQTYYINAAHKAAGAWSCSSAACDMLITVTNK